MIKLLQKALEAVRRLPPDSEDEIARVMLGLTGDQDESEEIDPAHLPDVLESLAQAKRWPFPTAGATARESKRRLSWSHLS